MLGGCSPLQAFLKGVHVTSTPGIKDDLINAGAIWHDVEAIASGHIISARRPPDLPHYLPLLIKAFVNRLKVPCSLGLYFLCKFKCIMI